MSIITAIQFESERSYKEALGIVLHDWDHVDESISYCILRERGAEAKFLIDNNLPVVFYDQEGRILDTNVMLDNIPEQCHVVYRKNSAEEHFLHENLKPLLEGRAVEKNWVKWVNELDSESKEALMGRDTYTLEAHEMASKIDSGELASKLPLFIKTQGKGPNNVALHQVIETKENLNKMLRTTPEDAKTLFVFGENKSPIQIFFEGEEYFNEWEGEIRKSHDVIYNTNDDFIISEPMSISHDNLADNGKKEYRCFVVGNEVVNFSRYTDYKSCSVPDHVKEFAQKATQALKEHKGLPEAYVMDVAELDDDSVAIVEFNDLSNSGRYLDNDVEKMYTALYELEPALDKSFIIESQFNLDDISEPKNKNLRETIDLLFNIEDDFEMSSDMFDDF